MSKIGILNLQGCKTKYLVFEYEITSDGRIYIKKFHCLNIWDIVEYNNKYPISIQNKVNYWCNIRPSKVIGWTDKSKTPRMFIEGIIESLDKTPNRIKDKCLISDNICQQFNSLENKYLF